MSSKNDKPNMFKNDLSYYARFKMAAVYLLKTVTMVVDSLLWYNQHGWHFERTSETFNRKVKEGEEGDEG